MTVTKKVTHIDFKQNCRTFIHHSTQRTLWGNRYASNKLRYKIKVDVHYNQRKYNSLVLCLKSNPKWINIQRFMW